MTTEELVLSFAEKFGVLFRPGSPTELASAELAGVPESLLEFYREYEPNESGQGKIRFYPLEQVVAHMTDYLPGRDLSRHGYLAFAGTEHGDSYFVRPKESKHYEKMPVYLFSHESSFKSMSSGQIEEFASVVSKSIPDFLFRAISDELATDPYEA